MKSKMILVAFLLVLYIGPMIFISSYASPAIPTEQNMNKDFSISAVWYNETWDYRKLVSISGASGAGADYQVNITVTYDSDMQTDFDDIRFTDNDGSTPLDHWRESYTASTTAVFWVKVADNLDTSQTIYMYYGHSTVSSASNGTATFLFYEDWSSQSLGAWTIPAGQADGSTSWSVTDATQGGYVAKVEGNAEDSYIIYSDFTYVAPFATMFRANIEETTTGNNARVGTGWAGDYGWAFMQNVAGTAIFNVVDDDTNFDNQAMDSTYYDSWTIFQIHRGLEIVGHQYTRLLANEKTIELGDFDPDAETNPVFSIQNVDSEDDIYCDWVACRKFNSIEPWFFSFGAEEDNSEWNLVNEVELIFSVPVDETGLNILLIFLGLIMIPTSTIYAAKGGLKEASTDKLFYFLIIFVMGWGLFLGGIFA